MVDSFLNKLVPCGPTDGAEAAVSFAAGVTSGGSDLSPGLADEQQAHLSAVSGLDTRQVSQVHLGVAGLANMPMNGF